MKIFLTGVAGYIGSVVTEYLLDEGYDVFGIDNFQEGDISAIKNGVKFFEGDYGDKDLIDRIFSDYKINCVMHFAAETTVGYSMTRPSLYFKNNVINGINLLDIMLKHNINNIIFSSTAAVYGEPKYIPMDENHDKIPVNAYGESKLMFEKILDWYHKSYGIKYNLFRYFNAAGATKESGESRKHEDHLLPLVFKSIFDNNFELIVYGNDYNTKDGTCIRDYVHVKDIANAHLLGLKNLNINSNGKYNLGSASGFSILEVIETVEKITQKKVKWKFGSRRNGDPMILVASNDHAIKELGWNKTQSNLDTIIKDSFEWFEKIYYKN